MKKIILTFLLLFLMVGSSYAAQDRYSKEYLQNHKHFSPMNSFVENIVKHNIKSSLKKETGANFDVIFKGYTVSSMNKGIFKYLELTAENVTSEGIPIPYVHIKSLSDYNYIDYKKDPIEFKSDMKFAYDMELSEKSMNEALKHSSYNNVLNKINNLAYPMFQVKGVSTKIINNNLYVLTEYNFPIMPSSKNKVFVASSDIRVENGQIKACDVKLDSAYGNIALDKVANLLNLLNPLGFTMNLLESKQCNGNIENVNIVDNKIKIDGKIYIKGE